MDSWTDRQTDRQMDGLTDHDLMTARQEHYSFLHEKPRADWFPANESSLSVGVNSTHFVCGIVSNICLE